MSNILSRLADNHSLRDGLPRLSKKVGKTFRIFLRERTSEVPIDKKVFLRQLDDTRSVTGLSVCTARILRMFFAPGLTLSTADCVRRSAAIKTNSITVMARSSRTFS